MNSAFDLTGRSILVVGAAGGIGRATTKVLGAQGASLVLADREAPFAAAAEVCYGGGAATAIAVDVADRGSVEAAIAGCGVIDGLVYLAAICPWGDDWSEDGWDATFDNVMAVNLRGAAFCARAVMPAMARRGSGRIVLVGSLAGKTGGLIAGAHYTASKGGLHALVKWLAQRGAPDGVLVNGVAPASTATPMMDGQAVDLQRIPLRRMSRPEEVAWPIAFLCSDAASYVCGTILDVNGGVYMG
jgi:NAD(P)-dependent dehydrogenase (short-subunit alcohol dehydrogenase family)